MAQVRSVGAGGEKDWNSTMEEDRRGLIKRKESSSESHGEEAGSLGSSTESHS